MNNPAYISVSEAASLTGRPVVTVRWWARNKRLRSYKTKHVWMVHRLDVLAYEGERRSRPETTKETDQ